METPPSIQPPTIEAAWWRRWIPVALAVAFLLILLPKIDSGTLWHHDELLTANRAREMLVRGDPFAVTVNFVPSVKKPPLQYWLCAVLLYFLPNHPELAVRLPTLLGGAACLLAVAALARAWNPETDAAFAVWSSVLLAGCGYLIHFSRVGLLDTNAALLSALALVAYQRAQHNPRWWWVTAGLCVVGAWQKAPYGLAAWTVLALAARFWHPPDIVATSPRVRQGKTHAKLAFAAAVLGSLGWWVIQFLRTDSALLLLSGREQVGSFLRAHDSTDQGFRPWLYWFWLARDWALPGLCAPLAAVAALRMTRSHRAAGLGLWCILFGGALTCLAYRAERYLVVITPLLAVLVANGLSHWSRVLPAAARGWVLPLACASTLPVAIFQFLKPSPAEPDLRLVSRELAHTRQQFDQPIFVCTDADPNFEVADFVLFYADLHRPVKSVTLAELDTRLSLPPCLGICDSAQWVILSETHTSPRLVFASGGWVLWEN